MWETSNRAAELRAWACSAKVPANWTGSDQPANPVMRPPSERCSASSGVVRRRSDRGGTFVVGQNAPGCPDGLTPLCRLT